MAETKQMAIADVDWTKQADIIQAFPIYVREQIALARSKNVSRTVDIAPFDLKAPFSSNYLLYDTRLLIEPNKKYCLQGDSGTGKSTLFESLASGTIKDFPKHLQVYHCQEIELDPKNDSVSVLQSVVQSHEYRNILLSCQAELKKRISAEPAPEPADLEALKSNLEFVELRLQQMNSDNAEDRASKMLRVLGFDEVGQSRSVNSLSGGLRMRVALCAAFFVEPDLLLLDEPTNHLDFPSVLWLENRLRSYRKSFILICHDRDLLENVASGVMLLGSKKITMYDCGFAEYEKRRAKADKKYAEEVDKFIARNRNVDFSSPAAREKAEKQAWLEAYMAKQVMLAGKFTFPNAKQLPGIEKDAEGKDIPISLIKIDNVRFSYNPENLPFIFDDPISIDVTTSTRIGVMGPNGAGKSTFLKLLTGRLIPTSGTVTTNKDANVAYFAQHHVQELDLQQTAIEFMIDQFPEVTNAGLLRKHLEKVGITGSLVETRMHQLSGGQRSCVIFAKITYECPHLLIMDEPTNFLDLESVDSLISASNKFPGALLLVSHNRQFLNKCAKQYLSIVPGQFNLYDDLKTCERATYTFIQEMESGEGHGKIGAGALIGQAGAGTNAMKKEAAPAAPEKKSADGFLLFGGGGAGSAALKPLPGAVKKPAPAPAAAAGRGGAAAGRGGARGGAAGRGGARGGAAPRGGARGGGRGGR